MPPKTKAEMSQRILAMEEVFITPLLPYKQYLTCYGNHSMGRVDDNAHFFAQYDFPEQQIRVSLIHGPLFHCSLDAPYEWKVSTALGHQEEPEGYKTEEELYILLTKILGGSYGIQK